MNEESKNAVFEFIEEKLRCKPNEIAQERSLNRDLGVDGDDAVEFFEAFAKTFKVDITELWEEWSRYFRPEPSLLRWSSRSELPLRVARIVQAAESGRWQKLKDDFEA